MIEWDKVLGAFADVITIIAGVLTIYKCLTRR